MNIHKPLWHHSKAVRSGDDLAFGERAADKLKRGFGSWAFLIALNVFIALWIGINVVSHHGFDLYPFILLNLLLSWLAAQQGGALQIAANRGDRIASEVALHTEQTADELLLINKGQMEILTQLHALQQALEDGEELIVDIGDSSAALACVAEAQAAIDAIHGKKITINVNVDQKPDESDDEYIARLKYWTRVLIQKRELYQARLLQRYIDKVNGETGSADTP